jgi:hypothetical protein
MSLVSYADLQAQVANWLARADLNTYIPDMITLFEAAACRRLKVRPQETTISLATTGGTATLPSDFLGWRRVTWTGSPNRELQYVAPPIYAIEFIPDDSGVLSGLPLIFTVEGSNLKVKPIDPDDNPLTFTYYQRVPAVSSALNWLWTNHPDAYVFGTLAEANFFVRGNDALQMAAGWKARRDEVFDEIQRLDFNERQGMSIRIIGRTP